MFNNLINWGNYSFQDESTISMIGIKDLHENILFYLIIVFILVLYYLFILINRNNAHYTNDLNHHSLLELIWTLTPAFILLLILLPSIKLLYSIDEVYNPLITLKIIGHQWYWSYSLLDINFSSYLKEDYLLFKYLETDQPLYLPILIPIRLIVTASDVIHSWAIPAFGIKIDAIPGRLNQGLIYILNKGIFFGQCSELCGLGHALMPIEIHSVNNNQFLYWIESMK